ncbi:MAG: hypothetical protein BECKG1743D_GA0114223_109502, partial [Candidatus Kentron sp. G]
MSTKGLTPGQTGTKKPVIFISKNFLCILSKIIPVGGGNPSSAQAKQPMVLTLNRHWRQYQDVTARVISGVASHIQVEETEALHVSRIALMVRGYLRSECVK